MFNATLTLRQRFWPPVPDAVRDELALLRLSRLHAQIPMLHVTMILAIIIAMLAAPSAEPFGLQFALPLMILGGSVWRLWWWVGHTQDQLTPDAARRRIRRVNLIASIIAVLCSAWCIMSWTGSGQPMQAYYVLFIVIGAQSVAFCLSSIRCITLTSLAFGVLPMAGALIVMGDRMDHMAAAMIIVAAIFLLRMIVQQHAQLIDMLQLKNQLHEQANTDALTGLLNRRALHQLLDADIACAANQADANPADAPSHPAIVLLDLDGFKPVNDRYGHATGDELLRAVAGRLRLVCGDDAVVSRLGGDEFAILVPFGSAAIAAQIADRLLIAFVTPFVIHGTALRIGASVGIAQWPQGGTTGDALIATADRALYVAKAEHRAAAARAVIRAKAVSSPSHAVAAPRLSPIGNRG